MTTLRLASWNIRKCIGLDRRRDPERVLQGIASLKADILALQEADRRLGRRPSALPREAIGARTGLAPVETGTRSVSLGWHGNALLLAPDFEAAAVHRLELPGLEPRGALAVDVEGRAQLRVVAVHLGLRRVNRAQQLATILGWMRRQPPRPTAIIGDFNEWSPSAGLDALEGFALHSPGLTFHAARPVAPLDRIAVTQEIAVARAEVHQGAEVRRASDHLPITADIKLRSS